VYDFYDGRCVEFDYALLLKIVCRRKEKSHIQFLASSCYVIVIVTIKINVHMFNEKKLATNIYYKLVYFINYSVLLRHYTYSTLKELEVLQRERERESSAP
jgi:hypothetical protein